MKKFPHDIASQGISINMEETLGSPTPTSDDLSSFDNLTSTFISLIPNQNDSMPLNFRPLHPNRVTVWD